MKSNAEAPSVNSGSMADIAFLLLIFFLVTTTISQEEGLTLKLPPEPEQLQSQKMHDRNVFKILINSQNQFLIEGEAASNLTGLNERLKAFILNRGHDPNLSDTPEKAIISIKTSRGTDYKFFIAVLDEAKGAYYDIYAQNVGLTSSQYRQLDPSKPSENAQYQKGKEGIPMNISIAEPEKVGS